MKEIPVFLRCVGFYVLAQSRNLYTKNTWTIDGNKDINGAQPTELCSHSPINENFTSMCRCLSGGK